MDKKAILFAGPPGSGKDTCAIMTRNFVDGKVAQGGLIPYRSLTLKFADPIKAAAHALYGLPYSAEHYEKTYGHEWKDKPQIEFFGETPRSVYIAMSEEFAKRKAGPSFFGRIAVRTVRLAKSSNLFIFSDSGFGEEALPIIAEFGIQNVIVCNVSRSGCDYRNDSRSNWTSDVSNRFDGKLIVRDIPNNYDKSILRQLVRGTIRSWLGIEDD